MDASPAGDDTPRNSANELMHGRPCANDTAPGEGADAAGYRVFCEKAMPCSAADALGKVAASAKGHVPTRAGSEDRVFLAFAKRGCATGNTMRVSGWFAAAKPAAPLMSP